MKSTLRMRENEKNDNLNDLCYVLFDFGFSFFFLRQRREMVNITLLLKIEILEPCSIQIKKHYIDIGERKTKRKIPTRNSMIK